MVSQSPAFEGRSLFGLNAETRGERVLQKEVLFVQSQSPSGKKVSQNFLPSWGGLKLYSAGCVSRRLFKKRKHARKRDFEKIKDLLCYFKALALRLQPPQQPALQGCAKMEMV